MNPVSSFSKRTARLTLALGLSLGVSLITTSFPAWSQYDDGKVLLTGGVGAIDGAGGGGVTPWAVINGYGTRDGINASVRYTFAYLPDYSLNTIGLNLAFYDRLELSYAYSVLPTGGTFDTVGLALNVLNASDNLGIEPFNTTIKMHIYGAKIRLFGDAIYNSQTIIPQVAFGGFYKDNQNENLLRTLQANKAKDYELYLSATKLFFPISTLFNVTARYTSANQTGLTGFGGGDDNDKEIRFEGSIAHLLNKRTAIGVEYAQHGDNLDGRSIRVGALDLSGATELLSGLGVALGETLTQLDEDDWMDFFIAYAPSKNFSMTFAYAILGNITLTPDQHGFYASFQASF